MKLSTLLTQSTESQITVLLLFLELTPLVLSTTESTNAVAGGTWFQDQQPSRALVYGYLTTAHHRVENPCPSAQPTHTHADPSWRPLIDGHIC